MPAMPSPPRLRKRPLKSQCGDQRRGRDRYRRLRGDRLHIRGSGSPGRAHAGRMLRPQAPRWMSARPDTTEHTVIEIDRPQAISGLVYEVKETTRERTQEVCVETSEVAANRTAKFWFRNTTSAPVEPPISAKNSASISVRSPISVSRLFQTRAARHGDADGALSLRLSRPSRNQTGISNALHPRPYGLFFG